MNDKKNTELETKIRKEQAKKDKQIIDENFKKIKPDLEKIYNKFNKRYFINISEIELTDNAFSFLVTKSDYIDSSEIKYRFFATLVGFSYTRSGWKAHTSPLGFEEEDDDVHNDIYQQYDLKNKEKVVETIIEVFKREISSEDWPN